MFLVNVLSTDYFYKNVSLLSTVLEGTVFTFRLPYLFNGKPRRLVFVRVKIVIIDFFDDDKGTILTNILKL